LEECRGCDRKGTLIRHAPSLTVLALPVAMIEPSFQALLVPPVGTPPLTPAGEFAALSAAITMPSITVRADEKRRLTLWPKANPLPQNCFLVNLRHASSQAGLDNGRRFVAG
jgi:hypothetical protein